MFNAALRRREREQAAAEAAQRKAEAQRLAAEAARRKKEVRFGFYWFCLSLSLETLETLETLTMGFCVLPNVRSKLKKLRRKVIRSKQVAYAASLFHSSVDLPSNRQGGFHITSLGCVSET